jgi:DNA-binding MarR family transcriptional regulator
MAKKFDIRDRLGYRVQILSNKMILWAARTYMEKFGIGVQEWRVLTILMRKGEGTAKLICELTLMDKGNVSRSIKKLIQAGNLKETADKLDKRSSVLVLTSSGRKLYNRVKKVSDAREKKFLSALSPSEKKALPNILNGLEAVMEELLEKQAEK